MVRFDSYTATAPGVQWEDMAAIVAAGCRRACDQERVGRGHHGFSHRWSYRREDGDELGAVSWGGQHGSRVMIEVKGEETPAVVGKLRDVAPEHSCTRVDSCVDVDQPGAWDELLGVVLDVKAKHRLRGERRGDWDYPEDGRTQYLGATSSPVRARLYEKGRQPDYRHLARDNWVRLEVQVRPAKDAKREFSKLSALEVWGSSPFTRELAARVLHAQLDPVRAGTVWRHTERDRALRFMCRQYGPHLVSLKDDLGDWQAVGLTLSEILAEVGRLPPDARGSGGE